MRPSTQTAYLLADALGIEVAFDKEGITGKGCFDLKLGAIGARCGLPFKIVGSRCDEPNVASIVVEGPGNLSLFVQAMSANVEVHVFDRSLVAYPLSSLLDAADLIDVLAKSVKASWAGKRDKASLNPITWDKVPLRFA